MATPFMNASSFLPFSLLSASSSQSWISSSLSGLILSQSTRMNTNGQLAVIEAIANAFMKNEITQKPNFSSRRNGNAKGSQAPQMKNSRNIMIENFMRSDISDPLLSYNETGCHVRRKRARLQAPSREIQLS